MKEKQKGIDPLNVFVICVAIMLIVTAIINGAIKANAQGIKQIISYNGVNEANRISQWVPYNEKVCALGNKTGEYNGVNLYSYSVYTDYQETYYTTQYQYGDVIGEWTNQLTNTDIMDSNNNTVKRVSLSQGIWGNNSLTGIPVFTQLTQVENYFLTGSEEGNINRQPQTIEDSNIPAPRGMYIANNSLYDHFENVIQLTNYDTNYYVGYALRTTIPVQFIETKVGNRHRVTWSNVYKTDYMNKYSIADVTNYGEGYVPQDGKVDLYEKKNKITNENDTYTEYVKNKILELNGDYIPHAGYYTGLAYMKLQLLNGGWLGNEVLMYYYYVDSFGDTHIGPATQFNLTLPESVDFDFAGVLKAMNEQQVNYTTEITLAEKEQIQETNTPIYNETTQSGSNTSGNIGTIDTDDVGLSVETVRKTIEQLIDFTGDVPQFFGKIFTFFPQWLLNLIYIGMGLGIIVGIIKIIRG